jgi:hypothetical protein
MKHILLFMLLVLTSTIGVAQQTFPVNISVFNHSWAFPLMEIGRIAPVYPGLSLGTEYQYERWEKVELFQTINLAGFINQASGSAWLINSDFGVRTPSKWGLYGETTMGLGFMNAYHPSPIYEMNAENAYVSVKDTGKGSSLITFSFGMGYHLSKPESVKISPFIKYQWMASRPYFDSLPIRPHGLLHVGCQFQF